MTDNVDPQEISKFDALAHDWWNLQGSSRPLHQINPLRLEFITQYTEVSGKKILDVGCGGGILTESLACMDADATGIDLSQQAIDAAKAHAKTHEIKVHYDCCELASLTKKKTRYDIITCMEMLEHVPDPAAIIADCAALTRPDGYVFLSTLNRNVKAFVQAIVGAEYVLKLLPKGTHHYEKFIRPSELLAWCRQAGLQPIGTQGITYNPITKRYRLCESTEVNYLVACIKQT
jgi:2-polyprenyl-6-hydroxyphenyl methylase/3-demethylubiquinone-9 3-methyltransferase